MANGNDEKLGKIYRHAVSVLLGAVLSLGGAWAVHVRGEVTREEIPAMVKNYSSYTEDRLAIIQKLDDQGHKIDALATEVANLRVELAAVEGLAPDTSRIRAPRKGR